MTDFILGLLMTAVVYIAFPLIKLGINGGRFPKENAHRIALWNSIVLGLFFCILTIEFSEGNVTWNAAPAVLYYWINRAILTQKRKNEMLSGIDDKLETCENYNAPVSDWVIDNNYSIADNLKENFAVHPSVFQNSDSEKDKTIKGFVMSKKAKVSIVGSIAVLSIIAIALVLTITIFIPNNKYEHAQALLEDGKYDLAYSAFLDLGNFSDAKQKLLETRYLQAVSYRDKGDYEIANKIFEELGNYRDSKTMIHIHDFKKTATTPKSCTTSGTETYTCISCDKSYISTIDASHNYGLVSEKVASCTEAGEKKYSCFDCGDSYVDTIAIKSHNYKSATCTTPKTCLECGQPEGIALGHSNSIICSRCGEKIFNTLTYTGKGSEIVNYTLPNGKFKITATLISGEAALDVKVHYGDSYEWLYIIDAGNSEIKNIVGPVSNGTIVINASSDYLGKSSWKISIEPIAN